MMMVNNPRALIVEDDKSWQQILREILEDLGFVVDVADKHEEGVTILRDISHSLVIVDLSLKGDDHRNKDGLRILEAAKLYDPACTTILLTGYATVELAVSAINEYGALTCLQKETFNRNNFYKIIQQHVISKPAHSTKNKTQNFAMGSNDSLVYKEANSSLDPQSGLAIVVDDDAGWRNLIGELLEELSYQVHTCNGYGEAIGRMNRGRYNLAVVDLALARQRYPAPQLSNIRREQAPKMQNLAGYRLLANTRAVGLPTIVVTGVATLDDIKVILEEHGVFACLEKQNFDRFAFIETVANLKQVTRTDDELAELTNRERQVLALLISGMTNKDISETLMISTNTVKRHLKSIYRKLDVHNRANAVSVALQAGLHPG
ncbi:MAG: response regulator [Chloroflexi bacterium]|nr:response regulator [Chloroflexota bacterium]